MMPHRKKRRSNKLALFVAGLLAIGLLAATAGCIGDPDSETFIIPEDESPGSGVPIGEAFRVSTIYPLPSQASSGLPVLGWADGEALVGYFAENGASAVPTSVGLQLLAPPYEKPQPLAIGANDGNRPPSLSPDGKLLASWTISPEDASMTLVPLDGSPVQSIAVPQDKNRKMLSRQIQWSSNSRYLAFMTAGDFRTELLVVVCDAKEGTVQQLPLHGFSADGSVSVMLSDDGNAALLDDGNLVAMAERAEDGSFDVQYDHPSRLGGGSSWMDADRFVFLGSDGTLFLYDTRNGELSVLLEKIGGFSLSPDRLAIAYTRADQEAIYAGKLQGNNVLYQTTVYQGVVPERMAWSLSGGALLIDGRKQPSGAAQEVAPAPVAQAGERLQTFILTFQ